MAVVFWVRRSRADRREDFWMRLISRRVLFALGLSAAASGRALAQNDKSEDIPTCRTGRRLGSWTVQSTVTGMTSSSQPTVSDRIRTVDERHEIVVTIRRTARTITSGRLKVTIL